MQGKKTAAPAAAPVDPDAIPFHPAQVEQAQLESYVKELFTIGDVNGDGVLQPSELAKLLSICGFDLTSSEILDFVAAADTNKDGVIEFDEFVPLATEMLKKKQIDSGAAAQTTQKVMCKVNWAELNASELQDYLKGLFSIADANGDGVLQPQEFIRFDYFHHFQF